MMFLYLSFTDIDELAFYKRMWIVGDNFLARTFREGVKLRNTDELFMKTHFKVEPVGSSRFSSSNTNMLSRIENSLAKQLNDNNTELLPEYIIVVLDVDLIQFLGYDLAGFAEMMGDWIEYLTKSFTKMIHDRKAKLPRGAIRFEKPMFYWANTPLHKNFYDNEVREEFNFLLDAGLKEIPTMRTLKLKEIWNYRNDHLVDKYGNITSYGVAKYWSAIDAAIKFNVIKHEQFLRHEKRSVYETLEEMSFRNKKVVQRKDNVEVDPRHPARQKKQKTSEVPTFFKKNNNHRRNDQYHWSRREDYCENGRRLPKPPVRRHINF